MKAPIVGLPMSGKTTLFRALAMGHLPEHGGHVAAVPVPDRRLELIAEREKPKKVTHATITFVDVGAMRADEDKAARLDKMHELTGDADVLILVVQAFGDIDYRGDALDPKRHLQELVAELILTDLAIVESRGERVEREHKARRKGEADWEWDLIRRLRTHLGAEGWARELAYNDEEMRMLRGYGLLTMRPALVVFNCGEDDLKGGRCAAAESWANQMGLPYEVISAELELELSELSETDRADFLAEYGLASLARERIIGKTYELVQAVTFFTVNENEARAWTVPHGTTARTAAGKIHTDMEKGFVRAEVVAFADYESAGGMSQARQSGKVRLEGQDYVVQDGDIVQIRFTR